MTESNEENLKMNVALSPIEIERKFRTQSLLLRIAEFVLFHLIGIEQLTNRIS